MQPTWATVRPARHAHAPHSGARPGLAGERRWVAGATEPLIEVLERRVRNSDRERGRHRSPSFVLKTETWGRILAAART
jgi:hypothetical protein